MGAVPLQVPWAAGSGEACTAVPEMVGGEVLTGEVTVPPEPVLTEMLSATIENACDGELLPIWTEVMPVAGIVAVIDWYTVAPLTNTSTVPVAAPVAMT